MTTHRRAPCISVITPNYNHGHYLPGLVEALAKQSPPPLELLIIDDASTDNSIEVARELEKQFPFVRLITCPSNRGVVAAMNLGVTQAKGEFLSFRAADDLDLPGHHETALQLLDTNPGIALFCGDLRYFSDCPERGVDEPVGFSEEPSVYPREESPHLIGTRWVNGHTVLIRRQAMLASSPFIEEIAFISDWFHLMAAGFRGGFCYAPQAVVAARVSAQSYSSQKTLSDAPARDAIKAMLLALLGPYRDTLEHFLESKALVRFGEPMEAAIASDSKFTPFQEVARQIRALRKGSGTTNQNPGLEAAIAQSVLSRIKELRHIATHQSIWIYGGGGHTRALLSQWQKFDLPNPSGILCSTTPEEAICCNLPAHPFDSAPLSDGDVVILSSKSYEGYMANRIHETGNLRCFAIWNRNLDRLD